MKCYRIRTKAQAIEDLRGAIDVPFMARRISRWAGLWTFTVVTERPDLFEAWVRGNLDIDSWQDETNAYNQAGC
jgi:hypothetical protein